MNTEYLRYSSMVQLFYYWLRFYYYYWLLLLLLAAFLLLAFLLFRLCCGSVLELISKFYINEMNLRTLKSLNTALNCQGQIQPNCKQLTIG